MLLNPAKWLMAAVMLNCLACSLEMALKEKPELMTWFGKLIFNTTSNTDAISEHDDPEFQSDQSASAEVSQLAQFKLQRLSPLVQCAQDSMSLIMRGQRLPSLMVDSEDGPLPPSQMPSYCGFSVKRARRGIQMVAKYDCCNMAQEGDGYVLPLLVAGAMVKMSCPVAPPQPAVSCTPLAMVIDFSVDADSIKLKVDGVWWSLVQASSTCGFALESKPDGWRVFAPYISSCWQIEDGELAISVLQMNSELLLTCPAFQLPTTTAQPAQDVMQNPSFPFPYPYQMPWPFWYGYPGMPFQVPNSVPLTTLAPTTTTRAPSYDAPGPVFPQMYYPGFPSASQGHTLRPPKPYLNQQYSSFPGYQYSNPPMSQQHAVSQFSPLVVNNRGQTQRDFVDIPSRPKPTSMPLSDSGRRNVPYPQFSLTAVKGRRAK